MLDGRQDAGIFFCRDGQKEQWCLRYSKRARRARIGVSPQKGIEVVLPAGSRMDAAVFVEQHRDFIDRALIRMRFQREAYQSSLAAPLPASIDLPTAGEVWQAEYRDIAEGASVSYRTKGVYDGGGTVTLSGGMSDVEACRAALRRFVVARAKVALPELLMATAGEFGIAPAACCVKNTRTRLGSCNSEGVIMLAAQLIFYPPELSFHIMCHELAHLSYLNHSAGFHGRLESLDPAALRHAKELKKASLYVPAWMDRD